MPTSQLKIMQMQKNRRLGVRIVSAILLCTLAIAILVSGIQIYRAYQNALVDVQTHFVDIERSYLPSLAGGMWSVDPVRINALLDGIAQIPDVGRVRLTDELRQTWERRHQLHTAALFTRTFTIIYREDGENFHMGELTVELMPANIYAHLTETAAGIAITTTATLLLSVFFVFFILRHWISRHLEKMAIYAQALDLSNLDTSLTLDRPKNTDPDELDMVVNAINQMRLSIKEDLEKRNQLDRELAVYREHLELLVNERTEDLQQKTGLLEMKSEELLQQNRELDAYAHTVAHDLKQPVSNLLGASNLLNADKLQLSAEKKRELLNSIQRSALKLHSIIDSLLMLASIRKNDGVVRCALDLKNAAKEACARMHNFAEQHNAAITIGENWPIALGYEQWIEEIWANYLSNAIKYGGPSPKIHLDADMAKPGFVRFWVKDFGEGLNETQQKEIFKQFVRFDADMAEGHGLGLSIVKRIAHRLGGEVGYEKSADGGSIFWFSLPLAER